MFDMFIFCLFSFNYLNLFQDRISIFTSRYAHLINTMSILNIYAKIFSSGTKIVWNSQLYIYYMLHTSDTAFEVIFKQNNNLTISRRWMADFKCPTNAIMLNVFLKEHNYSVLWFIIQKR